MLDRQMKEQAHKVSIIEGNLAQKATSAEVRLGNWASAEGFEHQAWATGRAQRESNTTPGQMGERRGTRTPSLPIWSQVLSSHLS